MRGWLTITIAVVPHITNDGQYPGRLVIPVVTQPKTAAAARKTVAR